MLYIFPSEIPLLCLCFLFILLIHIRTDVFPSPYTTSLFCVCLLVPASNFFLSKRFFVLFAYLEVFRQENITSTFFISSISSSHKAYNFIPPPLMHSSHPLPPLSNVLTYVHSYYACYIPPLPLLFFPLPNSKRGFPNSHIHVFFPLTFVIAITHIHLYHTITCISYFL